MVKITNTERLIIGAGPYGLSLANYLKYSQQDFIIVGRTMSLWRSHTFDNLTLRSDCATSVIKDPANAFSFRAFCNATDYRLTDLKGKLPVSVFREYIDWCIPQFSYDVIEQHVVSLKKQNGRFVAELESGDRVSAAKVVVASGVAHHLHIPKELTPARKVIHSFHTTEIQELRARKVLVVGAGQSAAESIAVLSSNGNQVDWFARSAPIFYSEPLNLPKWLFDIIVQLPGPMRLLPPNLLAKMLSKFSATTITPDFKELLALLPRMDKLPSLDSYHAVIAATGYRYSLDTLKFMAPDIVADIGRRNDMPVVDGNLESTVRGLYFCGAITEPFFGPSMRFMIGSHYSARRLAKALA